MAGIYEGSFKDHFNLIVQRWLQSFLPDEEICSVEIADSVNKSLGGGCPTCGYGADEDSWGITYTDVYGQRKMLTVDTDPLTWLAYTLFPFEDSLDEDDL